MLNLLLYSLILLILFYFINISTGQKRKGAGGGMVQTKKIFPAKQPIKT
jgi:hypothetical protein